MAALPKMAIAKLIAPRANQLMRRGRVLKAIDRGLRAGSCWIVAPAGYGKSMSAADYIKKKASPHIWYRIDEGDQDIASFFYYLTQSLRTVRARGRLPVFSAEYADQPIVFARRFFRSFFAQLKRGTLLVLDDLHHADAAPFRAILAVLLHELPDTVRCLFLARTTPWRELAEAKSRGGLTVIDQAVLRFTDVEARALVTSRMRSAAASVNVAVARGWAAGLVLLAEHVAAGRPQKAGSGSKVQDEAAAFTALATHFFDTLPRSQREVLLKLSLLPEIRPDLAYVLVGEDAASQALDLLQQRQFLVTRGESAHTVLHLHDLLRAYLRERSMEELPRAELDGFRQHAAALLHQAGYLDAAVNLALEARAWPLAHRIIGESAERLLAQGRRATLIEWCAALPDSEIDGWLSYWLGVATTPDDATAEKWFARAWTRFAALRDLRGQYLTAAHAVFAKTDSWRTHEGLAVWTGRMTGLIDRDLSVLADSEQLLVRTGILRAVDFAVDYRSDSAQLDEVVRWSVGRLSKPRGESATMRLLASAALIEHAGSSGRQIIFEQAVDSVREVLLDRTASPWALGLWLVAFGAVSGRYFAYARRGFPFASSEDALRAAIAIGERDALRGVEFGALYHLQLQMKSRSNFTGFAALITRLAEIADSRFTTQVAVVADCQAALHTLQGDFVAAYRACDRFNAAIEAADEPPIERWPHFITHYQVLLGDRMSERAAEFLQERIALFDGGVRLRTQICVQVAQAFTAKWRGDPEYAARLQECMTGMRVCDWPAILLNLPSLLAELCADALERDLESDFCRKLIARRALMPPASRPVDWPWPLRIFVLGEFRLERNGSAMDFGLKPPTRSLDIVRALAIAKDHTCSLNQLYEWLWPDAEGDQAKAACDQALHRLRKILGSTEMIQQREGKLQLAADHVWIDLDRWENGLKQALTAKDAKAASVSALERVFYDFTGPLLQSERAASWSLPASERARSKFIDLAMRLGQQLEALGDAARARSVYLRTIDMYPTSERGYAALLRLRLAGGDSAGALEDYRRYERILASTLRTQPSRALRALIAPVIS